MNNPGKSGNFKNDKIDLIEVITLSDSDEDIAEVSFSELTGLKDSSVEEVDVDKDSSVEILEDDEEITFIGQKYSSTEMLDNEETIAAEEELQPELDPATELQMLASDMNMPLDELLAVSASKRLRKVVKSTSSEKLSTSEAVCGTSEQLAPLSEMDTNEEKSDTEPENAESELENFYFSSDLRGPSDDEDEEFQPSQPLNEVVRIGQEYQAKVESQIGSPSSEPFLVEDKTLWIPPPNMSDDKLKEYINSANQIISDFKGTKKLPGLGCTGDSPLACGSLMVCKYDTKAAIDLLRKLLLEKMGVYEKLEAPTEDRGEPPSQEEHKKGHDEDGGESPSQEEHNKGHDENGGESPSQEEDEEAHTEDGGESPSQEEHNKGHDEDGGESPSQEEDEEAHTEDGGESPSQEEHKEAHTDDGGESPSQEEHKEAHTEDRGESPFQEEHKEAHSEDDEDCGEPLSKIPKQ